MVSSSPNFGGENQKSLKPPPRNCFTPPKIHSKYILFRKINDMYHPSEMDIHIYHLSSIYHGYHTWSHQVPPAWGLPVAAGHFPGRTAECLMVLVFANQVTRTWNGEVDTFGIVKMFQWNLPGSVWGESSMMNQNESDPLGGCCNMFNMFQSAYFDMRSITLGEDPAHLYCGKSIMKITSAGGIPHIIWIALLSESNTLL